VIETTTAHKVMNVGAVCGPSAPGTSAPGTGAVAVTRLVLTDFRNYAALRLSVDPAPVVLTGPNGAGKTNLAEALSFLSPGRGLRRARLTEVTRTGAETWAVAATLTAAHGQTEVGTGLEACPDEMGADTGAAPRRVVRIDGAPARSANALAGIAVVSWLTPQMDRLFIDGASARRRFLDRLVYGFDGGHARRVAAYEKALRERSRLLREGRGGESWLSALEETIAGHGVAVAAARRDAVSRLGGALEKGFGGLVGAARDDVFPRPQVSVSGEVEDWLASTPAVEAESRFRDALAASRGHDLATGGAQTGPHKSDFVVVHAAKGRPAAQCSTGEQKALLIAIVMADARLQAARLGRAPLLLLDEIAAHLDEVRRDALYSEILAIGAQAWLTGTDPGLFEGLAGAAQFLTVREGTVTPS
jgi:DNA replication and repair protein RecF